MWYTLHNTPLDLEFQCFVTCDTRIGDRGENHDKILPRIAQTLSPNGGPFSPLYNYLKKK